MRRIKDGRVDPVKKIAQDLSAKFSECVERFLRSIGVDESNSHLVELYATVIHTSVQFAGFEVATVQTINVPARESSIGGISIVLTPCLPLDDLREIVKSYSDQFAAGTRFTRS